MPKEITLEELEYLAYKKGYDLIDVYKNEKGKRLLLETKDGYKLDISIRGFTLDKNHGLIRKDNCYSLYNIQHWLNLNNKSFDLCDDNEYKNNQTKLNFQCHVCPETFEMDWDHLMRGNQNCPFCSGRRVGNYNNLKYLEPELCKQWIESEHGLLPNQVTRASNESVYWQCTNCPHKWWSKIADRVNGHNCPACSGNIVTDLNRLSIRFPDIAQEFHPTLNGDLTSDKVGFGAKRKVWWLCSKCGYSFNAEINGRTRLDKNKRWGCSNCSSSIGEGILYNILKNKNILFETQKWFDDCPRMDIKRALPLKFDFYLSDYNLCIEIQGEQHFKPIDFAGRGVEWATEQFEKQKIKDQIKRDYCESKSINLLEIPYWEFDNINNILIDYLLLESEG